MLNYVDYPTVDVVSFADQTAQYTLAEKIVDRAEMQALFDRWYAEVMLESSTHSMKKVESFQEIVRRGRPALPAIIDELTVKPSLLFLAAEEITGENPIDNVLRGDVRATAGAWIGWYQNYKRVSL